MNSMNLGYGLLGVSARRFPDRPALITDSGELTYAQLEERVKRAAGALRALGIRPGDRVGYMMNNRPEVVITFFAILRVGAIAVAVNVMLTAAELQHLVGDSEPHLIVCEPAVLETVLAVQREAASLRHVVVLGETAPDAVIPFAALERHDPDEEIADRHPDDPAMLMYTSGTTGRPKGAVMSHFWLDFTTYGWVCAYRLKRDDRFLVPSPFFYALGSVCEVLTCFRIGASAVLLERFRPETVLEAIAHYRPTAIVLVPTAVIQLLDHFDPTRHDVTSIRIFFVGASASPPALKERVAATFGWETHELYGLTEAHMVGIGLRGIHVPEGPVGPPGTNLAVRIIGDDGDELPRGQVGEIICCGDAVTSGYWRRPQETAESFRDGWFYTGDLGIMDEHGYIRVIDRKKEMIITGGANIYPTEVEAVILRHPNVAAAALIGVQDPVYGERPYAFVVLRSGKTLTSDMLIAHCRTELAPYKCPRGVVFMENLPLTVSGKVARRQLKDLALQRHSGQKLIKGGQPDEGH